MHFNIILLLTCTYLHRQLLPDSLLTLCRNFISTPRHDVYSANPILLDLITRAIFSYECKVLQFVIFSILLEIFLWPTVPLNILCNTVILYSCRKVRDQFSKLLKSGKFLVSYILMFKIFVRRQEEKIS